MSPTNLFWFVCQHNMGRVILLYFSLCQNVFGCHRGLSFHNIFFLGYLRLSVLAALSRSFQTEIATGLSTLSSQRKTGMSHRLLVWTLTARGEAQSVAQKEQLCYACQHGATLLPVYQRCWQLRCVSVSGGWQAICSGWADYSGYRLHY